MHTAFSSSNLSREVRAGFKMQSVTVCVMFLLSRSGSGCMVCMNLGESESTSFY